MFQDGKEHICVCPFLRLFISNYRDEIECINKNNEFLLSFPHNLRLRTSFMITFFAIYKQNFLNYNKKILINRTQFYTEDSTLFLAQKSNLIEELFDLFYEYLLKYLKSPKLKTPSGAINPEIFKNLVLSYYIVRIDCKYF